MKPLGIGIEKVADEIKNLFPEARVHIMSKDHIRSPERGREIVEDFLRTPRTILLGTEFLISYLQKPFEHCVIASVDSLFSVPDYKMNEKIFNFLNILRNLSLRNFIIQSRVPTHFVIQSSVRGDMASFYREEMENRKNFGFPPSTIIIKLTIQGEKEKTAKEMKEILNGMPEYEFTVFPAFMPGKGSMRVLSALLRLKEGSWVDENLLLKLRSLPQNVRIEINPDVVV